MIQWERNSWTVLVDLWTKEEGPSDLVLEGTMRETESGQTFSVYLVYVP